MRFLPVLVLAYFAALIAAVTGWVLNLLALVDMLNGEVTALFVARVVGVFFAPLGAFLGLAV